MKQSVTQAIQYQSRQYLCAHKSWKLFWEKIASSKYDFFYVGITSNIGTSNIKKFVETLPFLLTLYLYYQNEAAQLSYNLA